MTYFHQFYSPEASGSLQNPACRQAGSPERSTMFVLYNFLSGDKIFLKHRTTFDEFIYRYHKLRLNY